MTSDRAGVRRRIEKYRLKGYSLDQIASDAYFTKQEQRQARLMIREQNAKTKV